MGLAHADHALMPSEALPVAPQRRNTFSSHLWERVWETLKFPRGYRSKGGASRSSDHPGVCVGAVKAELLMTFPEPAHEQDISRLLFFSGRHPTVRGAVLAHSSSQGLITGRCLLLQSSDPACSCCHVKAVFNRKQLPSSSMSLAPPLRAERCTDILVEMLCWRTLNLDVENNQESN